MPVDVRVTVSLAAYPLPALLIATELTMPERPDTERVASVALVTPEVTVTVSPESYPVPAVLTVALVTVPFTAVMSTVRPVPEPDVVVATPVVDVKLLPPVVTLTPAT